MALETMQEYECFKNHSNGEFLNPLVSATYCKKLVSVKISSQFLVVQTWTLGQQARQMEWVAKIIGAGVQAASFFTRKYRSEKGFQGLLVTITARQCSLASRNYQKFTTLRAATVTIQFAKYDEILRWQNNHKINL